VADAVRQTTVMKNAVCIVAMSVVDFRNIFLSGYAEMQSTIPVVVQVHFSLSDRSPVSITSATTHYGAGVILLVYTYVV